MSLLQKRNAVLFSLLLEKSDLKPTDKWDHRKLTSSGYIPLSIDRLFYEDDGKIHFALAHNGEMNGDVMADPDMEVVYTPGDHPTLAGMHYQNDYAGVFQSIERGNATQESLDSFLAMWLKNLLDQGHKIGG